jgi:hypothetical protein
LIVAGTIGRMPSIITGNSAILTMVQAAVAGDAINTEHASHRYRLRLFIISPSGSLLR